MAERRCETCRYLQPVGRDTAAWLECRRFPPTRLIPEDNLDHWPVVSKGAWCGEWQEKEGEHA